MGSRKPDAAGLTDLPDTRSLNEMALDNTLLAILVCPADRGPLLLAGDALYNPRLRRKYRIDDGIPVLLVDEATEVDDDEHQRLLAATQTPESLGSTQTDPS